MGVRATHVAADEQDLRICPQCEERLVDKRCPNCKVTTINASVLDPTDAPDPNIGRILLDQYEIAARLGVGGMGTVYRGLQLSVQRPVAIKLISRELARDIAAIKRFQREALLTSKLTHPNSIRLFEFGVTEDGCPFLVMELLEGRELAAEITEAGAMPVGRAVGIALQVLRSLREAHSVGIVHRDLKPANIFLRRVEGEGDTVKVMDFGIATGGGSNTKVTKTGMVIGTPAYMSPEQAGAGKIDARSDLYALGIILFEMLTGRVPFESETPVSVLLMQLQTPAPPIGELRVDLAGDAKVQHVLDRLLAKLPDDRPANAQEAIALLETLVPGTAGTAEVSMSEAAVRAPVVVAVGGRTDVSAAVSSTGTALTPPTSRRAGWLAAVAIAGAVTAVSAMFAMSTADRSESEQIDEAAPTDIAAVPATERDAPAAVATPADKPPFEAVPLVEPADDEPKPKARKKRRKKKRSVRRRVAKAEEPSAGDEPETGDDEFVPDISEAGPVGDDNPLSGPETTLDPAAPLESAEDDAPKPKTRSPAQPRKSEELKPKRSAHPAEVGPTRGLETASEAKRAYRDGDLSRAEYNEVVRALKTALRQKIDALKAQYEDGDLSRAEYKQRVRAAKRAYSGR